MKAYLYTIHKSFEYKHDEILDRFVVLSDTREGLLRWDMQQLPYIIEELRIVPKEENEDI